MQEDKKELLLNSWMTKNGSFQTMSPKSTSYLTTISTTTASPNKKEQYQSQQIQYHEHNYPKIVQNLRKRWNESTSFMIQSLITNYGNKNISLLEKDKVYIQTDETLALTPQINAKEVHSIIDTWFQKIMSYYTDERRYYHTIIHLEEMFGYIDIALKNHPQIENLEYNLEGYCTAILTLSTFFHDVIYDPKSSTNEENSSELYQLFQQDIVQKLRSQEHQEKEDEEIVDSSSYYWSGSRFIIQFILATKTHSYESPSSSTSKTKSNDELLETVTFYMNRYMLPLFLDIDMAVLGKEPDSYNKYASLIRKEYEFVPHDVYCSKRADILQSFIGHEDENSSIAIMDTNKNNHMSCNNIETKKKTIFFTDLFQSAFENQARQNLNNEILLLRSGIIPTGS